MTSNWDVASRLIFPIIVAILVALINRKIEYRSKVITYVAHAAGFSPPPLPPALGAPNPQAPQLVTTPFNTHSTILRNAGKKTAFNVRIGHSASVHVYVLEPSVQHEVKSDPSGAWEIILPALVPNEQVMVSYLYYPPLTWRQINSYAKSDEGFAKYLNVLPTPQPPRWALIIATTFFYLGVVAVAYGIVATTQWALTVSHVVAQVH
ncbi:hypothetical protein AB4Y40_16225 [Paraburkholderia sp. EG287B]|uniref:hypothetical protein n=1 Tax=Paraburkholderia sp. EG287B TaxID=3237010 RepID=UPI0034D33DB8